MPDRPLVPSSARRSGSTDPGRTAPVALGLGLLVAAALGACAPLLGVVTAADGSAVGGTSTAGWVTVLPALLVLVLAGIRPIPARAVAAGAGSVAVVRLVSDLSLVLGPDDLVRPDLFAETSNSARPFAIGAGAWLVVVADVLAVVVGVVAAHGLAAVPMPMRATGSDRRSVAADPAGGPGEDVDGPAARFGSGPEAVPPLRLAGNAPMIAVGCLGTVLVVAGLLSVSYRGGYLGLRLVPAAADLAGVLAAVVALLALAVTVLVAAGLPRPVSAGLLAGAGLVAAMPGLLAVSAVSAGAPTQLSAAAALPLAGGALVAASAGLNRLRSGPDGPDRLDTDSPDSPDGPGVDRAAGSVVREPAADRVDVAVVDQHLRADTDRTGSSGTVVVGALLLAAAAGCLLAWRWPILLFDGAAPTPEVAGFAAPAGPPFLLAAAVLAVTGVLALLPWTAQAGRTAAGVVWAGVLLALTDAGVVLSRLTRAAGNTPAEFQHTWSAGSGLWAGVAGVVLALAAAVLAPVVTRRVAEGSLREADDTSADRSRTIRRGPVVVLVVLVAVAGALPVWSADLTRSASLLRGYELGTLGVWAVTLTAIGAVLLAGHTLRPSVAAAAPVAAAVVLAQRCLLGPAIRDQAGFTADAGLVAGVVAVVALLVAAPLCWRAAGRVRTVDTAAATRTAFQDSQR